MSAQTALALLNSGSQDLVVHSLTAKNLHFESQNVSTFTVLDSTYLNETVSIIKPPLSEGNFTTNIPLSFYDHSSGIDVLSYQLPIQSGASGDVLKSTGEGGMLVWAPVGGSGGVDTVTAGVNIGVGTDPDNPVISLNEDITLTKVTTTGLTQQGSTITVNYPSADAAVGGYVLKVNDVTNDVATLVWAEEQGGLTPGNGIDITNDVISVDKVLKLGELTVTDSKLTTYEADINQMYLKDGTVTVTFPTPAEFQSTTQNYNLCVSVINGDNVTLGFQHNSPGGTGVQSIAAGNTSIVIDETNPDIPTVALAEEITVTNIGNGTQIDKANMDIYVNWDGTSVWDAEILLDNTGVKIDTSSDANQWKFDTTGVLTAPGNITTVGNFVCTETQGVDTVTMGVSGITLTNGSIALQGEENSITLSGGNSGITLSGDGAALYVSGTNSGISLSSDGATINFTGADPNIQFSGSGGIITFSDSTTQSTAAVTYTGTTNEINVIGGVISLVDTPTVTGLTLTSGGSGLITFADGTTQSTTASYTGASNQINVLGGVISLTSTVTTDSYTLTSGEGGLITFADGTTQSSAAPAALIGTTNQIDVIDGAISLPTNVKVKNSTFTMENLVLTDETNSITWDMPTALPTFGQVLAVTSTGPASVTLGFQNGGGGGGSVDSVVVGPTGNLVLTNDSTATNVKIDMNENINLGTLGDVGSGGIIAAAAEFTQLILGDNTTSYNYPLPATVSSGTVGKVMVLNYFDGQSNQGYLDWQAIASGSSIFTGGTNINVNNVSGNWNIETVTEPIFTSIDTGTLTLANGDFPIATSENENNLLSVNVVGEYLLTNQLSVDKVSTGGLSVTDGTNTYTFPTASDTLANSGKVLSAQTPVAGVSQLAWVNPTNLTYGTGLYLDTTSVPNVLEINPTGFSLPSGSGIILGTIANTDDSAILANQGVFNKLTLSSGISDTATYDMVFPSSENVYTNNTIGQVLAISNKIAPVGTTHGQVVIDWQDAGGGGGGITSDQTISFGALSTVDLRVAEEVFNVESILTKNGRVMTWTLKTSNQGIVLPVAANWLQSYLDGESGYYSFQQQCQDVNFTGLPQPTMIGYQYCYSMGCFMSFWINGQICFIQAHANNTNAPVEFMNGGTYNFGYEQTFLGSPMTSLTDITFTFTAPS